MTGARGRIAAWLARIAALAACTLAAPPAEARLTPPPGGAGAWSVGGALLGDAPGPLALLDQPAGLVAPDGAAGEPTWKLGLGRARLDELDALARVRGAAGIGRGALAAALGFESFGPAALRAERLVLGAARRAGAGRVVGVAASAWRLAGDGARAARAVSLDAGLVARLPAPAGRLTAGWSARSLVVRGDAAAAADPDWTAELALELGAARAHLARTRDLSGARTGAGVTLRAGRLGVSAGAVGPPVQWSLGVAVGGPHGARAAFARVVHPALGASDAVEGALAW